MVDPTETRFDAAVRALIDSSLGRASDGGSPHAHLDDPRWREGVAYAVHLLRHLVGRAHGMTDDRMPDLVAAGRSCCRRTLIDATTGAAEALSAVAGGAKVPNHVHISMLHGRGPRT